MSDFARLEDKLTKLRARERAPGEGRTLRGANADALLAAIVAEIDETILPRRLSFTLESGQAIHLVAANRKFQAIQSPVPDGIPAELADSNFSDSEDPAVVEVATVLRNFFGSGGAVVVSSSRPKTLFGSDVGVPTSLLRRKWDISEEPVTDEKKDPSALLTDFLQNLGPEVEAWMRIEGEAVTDQGGDSKAAAKLGDSAAVFLDGYFRKFDEAFPEPSLACGTLLMPPANSKNALFFVEIAEYSAIMTVKLEKAVGLAAHWQSLVAD